MKEHSITRCVVDGSGASRRRSVFTRCRYGSSFSRISKGSSTAWVVSRYENFRCSMYPRQNLVRALIVTASNRDGSSLECYSLAVPTVNRRLPRSACRQKSLSYSSSDCPSSHLKARRLERSVLSSFKKYCQLKVRVQPVANRPVWRNSENTFIIIISSGRQHSGFPLRLV